MRSAELPKRKKARLKDFDYKRVGAYFITVCTANREPILWSPVGADIPTVVGQMKRYASKKFGKSIWQKSYYDHIIRSSDDLKETRKYVYENPKRRYYEKINK